MINYKMTRYEKMIFFRQLSMIYDSEIGIYEGIDIIEKQSNKHNRDSFFEEIKNSLISGNSLSLSLSKAGLGIDEHEIKLIEIGETTGRITTVLGEISDTIEKSLELDSKLKSALRYPLILSMLTLAVIITLLVSVVPIFHEMLVSSGAEFDVLSKTIFSISIFLRNYGFSLALLFLFFTLSVYYYFTKTDSGKTLADRLIYNSIFTRKIKRNLVAVNFAKNLSLLLDSGIDFSEALKIIEKTITSKIIKKDVIKAKKTLDEGGDIEDSFKELTMFPDILLRIVGIASKSGHLVTALNKTELIMRKDLDESIDGISAKVEPILITILSLIVGIVLLSGIIPIFNILHNIA